MSNFDERSGVAACTTAWGRWYQTMEEVFIEVNLEEGTSGRQVKVNITPKRLQVLVKGETIIEGELASSVKSDDSVWTIEDKKFLRICLCKVMTTADQCWKSLLKGQYETDPGTYDEMEKKLTLQRYQYETETAFGGAD
ncbi:nudC domain-containing protein 2-like isoform X2 [Mercenaria mercenaria]|uniref:nudC domain-containing protein 2-like isoform X2 n=1 Tax=Mercenaria mercenaria TaxID=6596 RepID=UPI001E1D782F|nr:nudC domain-containing protein 2-like isoform X2 [Mercenaria mercenaria]